MKLISIVTPCFNESENISELYERIKNVINNEKNYAFEIIFIDNSSTDNSVSLIKDIISNDSRVRLIVNTRNFGHIRSPYYGILSANGDAVIYLASDLQDPPEYINVFLREWELGYKLVLGTKPVSNETFLFHQVRRTYYKFLNAISEVDILPDATGFGLYDKEVISTLRSIEDPYPFLRGLVCYLGYEIKTIQFEQPKRVRGLSKNNFYTLYDIGILGVVSFSRLPLRIATFLGFAIGMTCFLTVFIYLILKIIYWESFALGIAPITIGLFGLFGLLFIFMGILGEYIAVIHMKSQNRPIVVERERVNFPK